VQLVLDNFERVLAWRRLLGVPFPIGMARLLAPRHLSWQL
jgi:hypothetical protein